MIAGKKISSTNIFLIACLLALAIGLFGINYWHATRCTSDKSPQDYEDMIAALNRRLLTAESQVHRNEILVSKVIRALETALYKLEKKEFEELNQRSKDEAVQAALYLSSHPAPTFPEFPLSSEYESNMEKVNDLLDDIYSQIKDDDKMIGSAGSEEVEEEEEQEESAVVMSDAEAEKVCVEWRDKYHVVIGVSWGELPYDMQQKWLEMSCDYHLQEVGSKT